MSPRLTLVLVVASIAGKAHATADGCVEATILCEHSQQSVLKCVQENGLSAVVACKPI